MRALISGLCVVGLAGCVTRERPDPSSFATSLVVPESDGILIDWQRCDQRQPCISGEWSDREYRLGFDGSPGEVTGTIGKKRIELRLDPGSVVRLGDHAIELMYTDKAQRTILALTWNELDQKPIDSNLVEND